MKTKYLHRIILQKICYFSNGDLQRVNDEPNEAENGRVAQTNKYLGGKNYYFPSKPFLAKFYTFLQKMYLEFFSVSRTIFGYC